MDKPNKMKLFEILSAEEKKRIKASGIARNVYVHDLTIQELGQLQDLLDFHNEPTKYYAGSVATHIELLLRQNYAIMAKA